ncbi:LLM class flavin-dependent oxidoreductase [Pontibacillus litoralis]|uniref:Luciferase n=1 Tax=Pontibacillus litoralis JSM 072002 TaxID=1385512 RepID=A0A0A5G3R6_9BACI|nr:LLM class flavin-dependent oxidoreductase [Pontibacillus litoralis]KGX86684.1 luciferase [Pontibacillus litoralis JSM 072002]
MKLSILDQARITSGNTAVQALKNAEELAMLADELGYHRMWMAEHHGMDVVASSAPEITIAHLAAKTKNLRVGTGGTMVMHYSPLKLAEVFKTLSAYAPNRIDFGVGRAPGGDGNAIYAMSEGKEPQMHNMYEKIEQALQYMKDEVPAKSPYNKTIAMPSQIALPEAWLLGSSGNSAIQAGRMGIGYSFAQFFNGSMTHDILDSYRNNFKPSAFLEKPNILVTYMVTVAETKEEAEFEGLPYDISQLWLMRGMIKPSLTPEEAQTYPLSEIERMQIREFRKRQLHFVGDVQEVSAQLRKEQAIYGFDEAMLMTVPHSQEKRLNSYRLLAKELLDK